MDKSYRVFWEGMIGRPGLYRVVLDNGVFGCRLVEITLEKRKTGYYKVWRLGEPQPPYGTRPYSTQLMYWDASCGLWRASEDDRGNVGWSDGCFVVVSGPAEWPKPTRREGEVFLVRFDAGTNAVLARWLNGSWTDPDDSGHKYWVGASDVWVSARPIDEMIQAGEVESEKKESE